MKKITLIILLVLISQVSGLSYDLHRPSSTTRESFPGYDKISTSLGDMCLIYNPKEEVILSPISVSNHKRTYKQIGKLVEWTDEFTIPEKDSKANLDFKTYYQITCNQSIRREGDKLVSGFLEIDFTHLKNIYSEWSYETETYIVKPQQYRLSYVELGNTVKVYAELEELYKNELDAKTKLSLNDKIVLDPSYSITDLDLSAELTSVQCENDGEYCHSEVDISNIILYLPFDVDTRTATSNVSYDFSNNDCDGAATTGSIVASRFGLGYEAHNLYPGDEFLTVCKTNQSVGSKLSMCAWVYPEADCFDAGKHWFISADNGGWDWGVLIYQDTWQATTGSSFYNTGDGPSVNTWYHVCGVWNTTHTCVHINGGAQSYCTATLGNDDSTNYIKVGSATGEVWDGIIDEVLIIQDELTKADANTIYLQTFSKYINNGLLKINVSVATGSDSVNVTLNHTLQNDSVLGLQVWDGAAWSSEINMTSLKKETFSIDDTLNQVNLSINFYTGFGSNNHWSPILLTDIQLETFVGVTTTTTTTTTTLLVSPQIGGCRINASVVYPGDIVYANATTTEKTNPLDTFTVTLNDSDTVTNASVDGVSYLLIDTTSLLGNYSVNCSVNDTSNNVNSTLDGWLTVETTTTTTTTTTTLKPYIFDCTLDLDEMYDTDNQIITSNISQRSNPLSDWWVLGNTTLMNISTASDGSNSLRIESPGLGNWSVWAYVNDSVNNQNFSECGWMNIIPTTTTTTTTTIASAPQITDCRINTSVVVGVYSVYVNATTTEQTSVVSRFWPEINNTLNRTDAVATDGVSSVILDTTGLAGNYSIICWINDTTGLSNKSSDGWLTILTTTTTTTTVTTTTVTTSTTTVTTTTTLPTTTTTATTTTLSTTTTTLTQAFQTCMNGGWLICIEEFYGGLI